MGTPPPPPPPPPPDIFFRFNYLLFFFTKFLVLFTRSKICPPAEARNNFVNLATLLSGVEEGPDIPCR
jgi:hypothetical protein